VAYFESLGLGARPPVALPKQNTLRLSAEQAGQQNRQAAKTTPVVASRPRAIRASFIVPSIGEPTVSHLGPTFQQQHATIRPKFATPEPSGQLVIVRHNKFRTPMTSGSIHHEQPFDSPCLNAESVMLAARLNASRVRSTCLLAQHSSLNRRFWRYKTIIANVRPSIRAGNLSNSQFAPAQTRHEHGPNLHS
jgi:hypothetical protein